MNQRQHDCIHAAENQFPLTPARGSSLGPVAFRRASLAARLALGLFTAVAAAQSPEPAGNDVLFQALSDELKRSMTLQLEDLDKPYFVQYAVDDTVSWRIAAAQGAVTSSDHSHTRQLHSLVRVGSRELDNSNFSGRGGGGRRGLSGTAELPVDDDYLAVRHAVWTATDSLYKEAVEALTQKRAYMRDRTIENRPHDFTSSGAVTAIQARASFTFKPADGEDYTRRIAAALGEHRHLQNLDVVLTVGTETRYLVNSEGSRLRYGDTGALLRVSAEAQAVDGERLSDQLAYYAALPEQLPSPDAVLADVKVLAARLAATMQAPVLDDYTGPVLFDGAAAAHVFRQLLARGVAGQADAVGSQRRTGTDDLESRLGKRILPITFQVYDDPRQERFDGTFLAGHYRFDDEGISAQRVEIVVDGKLQGMVMSRAPSKQFTQSNGHGRRSGAEPRSTIGCLHVESAKGLSAEDLKKELLDAADAEGLKFGLRVASIQGRTASPAAGLGRRGGGGGGLGGAPTRTVGDPIALYKVYVVDGREELVRGCEFSALDLRNLRRIVAAGKVGAVHNYAGGAAPASSVIAPSVLFEEVEISRIRQEAEKKPILEAPHARR